MSAIFNMDKCKVYLEQFLNQFYLFLPSLIGSLILFFVFWLIGSIVKRIIFRLSMKNTSQNVHIYELLGRIFKIIMIIIGAITALGTLGVHVGALIGGLGLTGFAMGFAMKDMISNILAGILVLLYRPIRIGHYMEISGFSGNVSNIDLRYTTLENNEKIILVPNAKVFSSIVCIDK